MTDILIDPITRARQLYLLSHSHVTALAEIIARNTADGLTTAPSVLEEFRTWRERRDRERAELDALIEASPVARGKAVS